MAQMLEIKFVFVATSLDRSGPVFLCVFGVVRILHDSEV